MDQLAILQALRQEDFLQKALRQLQRDFSRIGIDFPILTSLIAFEAAEKEVQILFDAIIHNNPESISHILYIIDLSEIKVRQIIQRSENSSADLAYAILLRSGEKVYWKERFKLC